MAEETILSNWLVTDYLLPFLLMFFLVFAILEKTKAFGDSKKQLNALVAFVIGLIFVVSGFPKLVVGNLILFLTVLVVIAFIGILLWGFIVGGDAKIDGKGKYVFAGILGLILLGGVLWALEWNDDVWDFFTGNSIGSTFWTNVIFVLVIAAAIALAIGIGGKGNGG